MSQNTANSQGPPRADSTRKATPVDADRANSIPAAAAAAPPRNAASPSPGHYSRYSTGYPHAPPTLNTHAHYHQHHPTHQASATFSPYAGAASVDSYAYAGQPYQPGRNSVDTLQYAHPPSRSLSQSSASGSVAPPHEAVGASHYAPHYSPSFPGVSPSPSLGHSSRTRWAWVPIEVPQGHMSDDAHAQYAPYPSTFYTPTAAPVAHTPPTSHPPYQQAYGESAAQASPAYPVPSNSANYTPSYHYHAHPAHYMPPSTHNSHAHVATLGRSVRSGSHQPGHPFTGARAVENAPGAGNRRQSNQSSRSGSAQRRTSSNSSGNTSSPHPVSTAPPQRQPSFAPGPQSDLLEPQPRTSLPTELPEETSDSVALVTDQGTTAIASQTDLDQIVDAAADCDGAERVPGSGLRPHYHPQQGPRSEWVLWCGNVPQDATVEELWEVFSRLTPEEYRSWLSSPEGQEQAAADSTGTDDDVEEHGVLSIFIISRSNCAFVNYASLPHLNRAVKYFQGKQVRPHDARCPKLVCRVRKKDDEAQAGVAGQRGRGIHVAWLKQQRELERAQEAQQTEPQPLSPPIKDAASQLPAGLTSAASYSSSGSASYTSTNSSLFRHPAFRHRFFILKSLRVDDLDRSIETGYWATQPHNESVLDQAYRNSEAVYLIFGVNQTGQFHGYAKMAGPIFTPTNENKDKEEQRRRASLSSVLSAASNSLSPAALSQENGTEADPSQQDAQSSPHASGLRRAHPTLAKRDIDAAKSLFRGLSVDGNGEGSHSVPMTSPLPITPTVEEAMLGKAVSPQRQNTITPQTANTFVQANSWPYTYLKNSDVGNSSADAESSDRPRFASAPLGDSPALHVTAEPDEYGVRRMDMEAESTHTNSSQSDQPSLGPSDSASWSSADPRMAEQIALRAVIHNLRLDEMESRGQAEMLENQLRSSSNQTDTTVTAKASDAGTPQGVTRTPPRQSSSDSWGKPFRVEWIRTDPLSFSRVKKLRNPWRDNRQVKVSRDGTELEPGCGRQLLEEWNRLHPPAPAPVDSTKARKPSASSAVRSSSDEDE